MSVSNPNSGQGNKVKNPAQGFIYWAGSEGKFKERVHTGEDSEGKKTWETKELSSFACIILDNSLKSIGGTNETAGWRLRSNKIRDLKSQTFTIWNDRGKKVYPLDEHNGVGNYLAEKEYIKNMIKGRYQTHIYAYVPESGLLVEMTASGSFGGVLIDAMQNQGNDLGGYTMYWSGEAKKETKGTNTYFVPVLKFGPAKKDTEHFKEVLRLDEEVLQPYINHILGGDAPASLDDEEEDRVEVKDVPEPHDAPQSTDDDDLPF